MHLLSEERSDALLFMQLFVLCVDVVRLQLLVFLRHAVFQRLLVLFCLR